MTKNWVLVSIILGIISGVIAHLFMQNLKISLIVTALVLGISLWLNPKLFFARVLLFAFSTFISLNKLFFEVTGELFGIDFTVKSDTTSTVTTIILGIIVIICLTFFFLERNGKLKGTFLDFSKNTNSVGDITGSDITINQTINKK
jgi:uncharacterized membrane protein YeaQ/YmgE (transglycosylase-associated protein family)